MSSHAADRAKRAWAIPEGRRVYAIGDIHGRLDLLQQLLVDIDRDDAGRAPAATTLIFLGDLVDRGADSRGVIELLMAARFSGNDCIVLRGNHDEIFIRAVEGERGLVSRFHQIGGRETALSYGVTAEDYDRGSFDDLGELLRARVPAEHIRFLRSLPDWHQIGDYIFVHAGIRPGKPMREQVSGDMRWIRAPFLDYQDCHGAMVVHGHTPTADPEFRGNRIGIDTGAFQSGKLTCLGLEGTGQWVLQT